MRTYEASDVEDRGGGVGELYTGTPRRMGRLQCSCGRVYVSGNVVRRPANSVPWLLFEKVGAGVERTFGGDTVGVGLCQSCV